LFFYKIIKILTNIFYSEDQWNLYMDLITSVFRLADSGSQEVSVQTGLDFITGQQQKHPKTRGPFLAEIEFHSRILARSGGSSAESELCDRLVKYFERFGAKPTCALDLKLYVPSIGEESTKTFFDATLKLIDLDDKNVPKSVS